MDSTVKFRFGEDSLIGFSLKCKNCALAPKFTSLCQYEHACPVMRYAYDAPNTFLLLADNSWWSAKDAVNIGFLIDDLLVRWQMCSKSKKLAAECKYNTGR